MLECAPEDAEEASEGSAHESCGGALDRKGGDMQTGLAGTLPRWGLAAGDESAETGRPGEPKAGGTSASPNDASPSIVSPNASSLVMLNVRRRLSSS